MTIGAFLVGHIGAAAKGKAVTELQMMAGDAVVMRRQRINFGDAAEICVISKKSPL